MKVSILGTGRVGSAIAFAIVLQRLADELVLIGSKPESGIGDAADLTHASAFSQQMMVRSGRPESSAGSDVVILSASIGVPTAHDRYSQLRDNVAMFTDLVPHLVELSPAAVFIVVTNPVDLMTHLTLRLSGLPAGRVFGTGTLIDTARYRSLLAEHVQIHTHDIRAYILGEHGESQFPALSVANAGGEKLDPTDPAITRLAERARFEGHRVFAAKGYTNYAIAAATTMLLAAVRRNTREVFPVSTLLTDYHGVSDVCLSVPAVVGRGGIHKLLKIDLSETEVAQLNISADVLRKAQAAITPT